MNILILYASTEGQTRKIARHTQRFLVQNGHAAELMQATEGASLELQDYDAALLMASVHSGSYQPEIGHAVTSNAKTLGAMPNAFISVSLTAAGEDPEDWKGMRHTLDVFQDATNWVPQRIEHVAGAFRFSHYNWFKTWAMRWIAQQKDPTATDGRDVEYTDWPALEAFLKDWVAGIEQPA